MIVVLDDKTLVSLLPAMSAGPVMPVIQADMARHPPCLSHGNRNFNLPEAIFGVYQVRLQ
jgi:hypothetical protein